MTTKRAKLKPLKMWAAIDIDGFPFEATLSPTRVGRWRSYGGRVGRVLVTPIEPKKRGKK